MPVHRISEYLLANNYRRQMTLKLSQTRLDAYSRLWEMTGIAALPG